MLDVKKNYVEYLNHSKAQSKYSKQNFSYEKMVEKLESLLGNEVVNSKPVSVGLKLPKLKKVGQPQEAPKLKLPKLKKVE